MGNECLDAAVGEQISLPRWEQALWERLAGRPSMMWTRSKRRSGDITENQRQWDIRQAAVKSTACRMTLKGALDINGGLSNTGNAIEGHIKGTSSTARTHPYDHHELSQWEEA